MTPPQCEWRVGPVQCPKQALSMGGKDPTGEPVAAAIWTCEEHEGHWYPQIPGQLIPTLMEIGDRVRMEQR